MYVHTFHELLQAQVFFLKISFKKFLSQNAKTKNKKMQKEQSINFRLSQVKGKCYGGFRRFLSRWSCCKKQLAEVAAYLKFQKFTEKHLAEQIN